MVDGPSWLKLGIQDWSIPDTLILNEPSVEVEEMCSYIAVVSNPIAPIDQLQDSQKSQPG